MKSRTDVTLEYRSCKNVKILHINTDKVRGRHCSKHVSIPGKCVILCGINELIGGTKIVLANDSRVETCGPIVTPSVLTTNPIRSASFRIYYILEKHQENGACLLAVFIDCDRRKWVKTPIIRFDHRKQNYNDDNIAKLAFCIS